MPRCRRRPLPVLLAAVGCVAAAATAPALAKDTLIVGATLEPPHLDPTAGAAAAIDEVTYHNVFEPLTRIDRTGRVVPGLATDWTVSEDGLTYTFTLREGVTFHDGTSFGPEDVVFSIDRARAEDSTNAKKWYFDPIETVAATGPNQVTITLSRPDGLFLFRMGSGDASIVAAESAATNTTDPVGTGPYRYDGRVEGDRITLTRNPAYVGPAQVAFETVTFRYIPDSAAQVAAVLAGDVDVFPNIGSPESVLRFQADRAFEVLVGTTEGEIVMALNNRRAPFTEPLVRRAIQRAINRDELVAAAFDFGTPIGSHFAPHHPAYVDTTDVHPFDPEAAAALLAEAGYGEGFEATLMLPPPTYARRSGEIIQARLGQIGIDVELVPVEWAQWLEQAFTNFDYDMTIVAHTEPLDMGIYARGEEYYFGWVDGDYNALMAELDATADPDARAALYARAQRLLAEALPAVYLYQLAKVGVQAAPLEGMWANAPVQANDITDARWVE